jgi:hypothetical protein
MNKLIQFHIKNNYYVKITPLDKAIGCCATFPPNLLTNQPGYFKTYIVGENPDSIEVFENVNSSSRVIDVPRIVIRLLITEDILLNTIKRGISRHLMVVDGGKQTNTFHILKINLTKEELEEEKDLCIRFRQMLVGKERKGIDVSGFEEVLKCFENGGL